MVVPLDPQKKELGFGPNAKPLNVEPLTLGSDDQKGALFWAVGTQTRQLLVEGPKWGGL